MSTSAARHARPRRRPVPGPRHRDRHDHLLLVTHHYEPETGAPQRRWGALVPRLVGAGFRVTVLAPPPHYPAGVLDPEHAHLRPGLVQRGRHGERILRVRYREHSSSLVSRTADHVVAAAHSVVLGWRHLRARAHRPTVVVGTVPGIPSMFAAWALARLFRARFVVEMRDAWPDLIRPSGVVADGSGRRARAAVVALVHRVIVRMQTRSDLVVTTTETFAGIVESRGAANVGVVRNGTAFTDRLADKVDDEVDALPDDDAHPWARTAAARRLRGDHRPVAGSRGRRGGRRGARRAGRAARGAPRRRGGGHPHLKALATTLGAPVTFLGRVPHTDVPALYAWADTVLVSLRDWEPFRWTVPSKLYETMATRRHVTACVAGEAAELVLSLEAGDVVPPGDVEALAALWAGFVAAGSVRDRSRRAGVGRAQRGRRRARGPVRRAARRTASMRAAAPRDAVRALVLALSFGARAVVDDPVWLAIQAARRARLARRGAVRLLLVSRDPSARRALGLFLDGSPDDASRTVAAVLRAPGSRLARRVAAEVAVAVGHPSCSTASPPRPRPAARALAGGRRGRHRARHGVRPRRAPHPPRPPRPGRRAPTRPPTAGTSPHPGRGAVGQPRVLHHLTNSLPTPRAGTRCAATRSSARSTRTGWPCPR